MSAAAIGPLATAVARFRAKLKRPSLGEENPMAIPGVARFVVERIPVPSGKAGFKGLDAFEYAPQYQYAVVKTRFGAAVSLLCGACILGFMAYTLRDFVTGSVSKSTTSIQTPAGLTVPIDDKASMAMSIQYNEKSVYDPSVFKVEFLETTVTGDIGINSFRAPQTRDLGLRKCALPDDKTDAEYICPNATASVQGQYQDPTYRYVTVNVKLCSGAGCKNFTDVLNTALTARFTWWIYFENHELGSARRGYSRRTRVPKDAQYFIDFLLSSREVVTSPRIYFDNVEETLPLSSIEEFSPFLSTVVWKPGTVILRLLVRVSDSMMRDELKPYSFPSMFGDWGALWTALSLSLGALAYQYNQWTFERARR